MTVERDRSRDTATEQGTTAPAQEAPGRSTLTDDLAGQAPPSTSALTSATSELAAELRGADEELDAMCERFAGLREIWLRDDPDTRGDVSAVRRALHERLAAAKERFARARDAAPAEQALADRHAAEWTRELAARIQLAVLAPELHGDHQTRLFDDGHPDREAGHVDHVMDGAAAVAEALHDLQHYRGAGPPIVQAIALHGAAQLALQSVLQHRSVNRFFRLHDQDWVAELRARPDGDRVWETLLENRVQTISTQTARDEHRHDMAGGDPELAARFDDLAELVRAGVTANLDETDPLYGPVRALVGAAPADRQAFLRTLDRNGDYDAFATYCGPLYLELRAGTSYSADPIVDRRGLDGALADVEMLGDEMAEAGADLIEAIASLAENGGELVAGVLDGMATTGLDNPALAAALQGIVAGLAAIALGPATLVGVSAGIVDAVAADAELIAGILEDPIGFGEQVIALVEAMCSREGAELARALGHDMGRELCADLVAMADLSAPELAFEVGHLGGTIAWEIVKSLIGAGIAARIARFARSSRILRTLLPEPRRVPDGPDESRTGVSHGDAALIEVIADADTALRAGHINQVDYARVYSAPDGATARALLDQRIAAHHSAVIAGGDYVELASSLEHSGIVVEGTVDRVRAAATPLEQQVVLQGAVELAQRLTIHATAESALADYLARFAADPARELAIRRIEHGTLLGQRGEYVVVVGEARMVPGVNGTIPGVHTHPQLPGGVYDGFRAPPSIIGDVTSGLNASDRLGRGVTQAITLAYPGGPRSGILHTDAARRRYWFDLTTPDGRPIHVTCEGVVRGREARGPWTIDIGHGGRSMVALEEASLYRIIDRAWNPVP